MVLCVQSPGRDITIWTVCYTEIMSSLAHYKLVLARVGIQYCPVSDDVLASMVSFLTPPSWLCSFVIAILDIGWPGWCLCLSRSIKGLSTARWLAGDRVCVSVRVSQYPALGTSSGLCLGRGGKMGM